MAALRASGLLALTGLAVLGIGTALFACPSPSETPPAAPADAGVAQKLLIEQPRRKATRAELEAVLPKLEKWVQPGANDATNPWALAHGLVAFGPELKTTDGRLAIDAIADFLTTTTLGDKPIYVFPEKAADGTPVEPHPSLLTKTMVEIGVPLTREFKLKPKGKVTLDRLVADRERIFTTPHAPEDWRRFAWSFTTFLGARAERGTVVTQTGELKLDDLARSALVELELEQRFLEEPMKSGRPELVEKKKQDIFAHTCGGLHFIQAAVLGAKRLGDEESLSRARAQLEILKFRWVAERRIYRATMADQPKYRWLLLIQELKFHGHVLETFGLAHKWGVVESSPELDGFIAEVAGDLVDALRELESVYGSQDDLKKIQRQSYYDLIGDGCHAIRGLRLALNAYYRG